VFVLKIKQSQANSAIDLGPSFNFSSPMFATPPETAHFFSRFETDNLLGTHCEYSFLLEEAHWPTVEHYIQAMQYDDVKRQEHIRAAPTATEATRRGKKRFFQKTRPDWAGLRRVYMTRAVYTRAMTHLEIREALLATANELLVENNQYDYFWGCGRDRRGENQYGKVLMEVREKLRQDLAGEVVGPGSPAE